MPRHTHVCHTPVVSHTPSHTRTHTRVAGTRESHSVRGHPRAGRTSVSPNGALGPACVVAAGGQWSLSPALAPDSAGTPRSSAPRSPWKLLSSFPSSLSPCHSGVLRAPQILMFWQIRDLPCVSVRMKFPRVPFLSHQRGPPGTGGPMQEDPAGSTEGAGTPG